MDTQRLKPVPERSLAGKSRLSIYLKALLIRCHFRIYGFAAFVVILLASLLRLLIVQKGWPALDSDEATMGLMALHILKNGAHPLVFYGQDYMGTIEAYLAALSFTVFGPGVFALRLGMVLLFALFLLSTYLLISLLYSQKAALLALCILSLGSPELLLHELTANAGYGEIVFFGSLLLVLASWLALTSRQGPHLLHIRLRRSLVYLAWSLVAGLAIWSNPLILPFVLTTALLLFIFCRSELRMSVIALLVFGFLLGLAPQIIYKATEVQPPPASIFGSAVSAQPKGDVAGPGSTAMMSAGEAEPVRQASLLGQLAGSIMVSIPVITGGSVLCAVPEQNANLPLEQMDEPTLRCTLIHGVWGLGYLTLLLTALVAAYQLYWKRWEESTKPFALQVSARLWYRAPAPAQPLSARQATIRQVARLAVLFSAALTWFFYTLFPPAELSPWTSSRYLIGLLIVYPALLAFLWEKTSLVSPLKWQALLRAGASYLLLLVIAVTFLIGTLNIFQQFRSTEAQNVQQFALLIDLREMNARYLYTDYSTCDRLAFQSLEEIKCGVLQSHLEPGLNRYQPYADAVSHASQPFYVFPLHSSQDETFLQYNEQHTLHYLRLLRDGYAIYLPAGYLPQT